MTMSILTNNTMRKPINLSICQVLFIRFLMSILSKLWFGGENRDILE